MTKIEKIKIKNWTYEGQVKKGQPNGKGTLKGRGLYPIDETRFDKEDHKFKYEGSFKNGKMDGYGVLSIYHTTFINSLGQRGGKNRLDSKYEGEFRSGLKHGKGTETTFLNRPGEKRTMWTFYSGQWKKDKHFGRGEYKYKWRLYIEIFCGVFGPNGKFKKGNWIIKANDQVFEYEGSFKNQTPHGKGILKVVDKKLKIYFIVESNFFHIPHHRYLDPDMPPLYFNGKTIKTFYKDNKFKKILYKQKLEIKDGEPSKEMNITNRDHLKLLKLYEKCIEKYDNFDPDGY